MQSGYFKVRAKLPGLNEYTAANRANRYNGGKFKREQQELIGYFIREAFRRKTLPKITQERNIISIEWHEATRRRDVDNIQSAQKFILDSMVSEGVLPDDGRRWVRQVEHVVVDDQADFVVVRVNMPFKKNPENGEIIP